MMKKKDKTCLKRVILKFFRCNLNDPEFDLFTFLCEINLYISKLAKKKAANEIISQITDNFEKTVAVTKLKGLKWHSKNIY